MKFNLTCLLLAGIVLFLQDAVCASGEKGSIHASVSKGSIHASAGTGEPETPDPESVLSLVKKVADWQIGTPLTHPPADWTNAALYAGMAEWAKIAPDESYYAWLRDMGEKMAWDRNPRKDIRGRYHADDYCVGQMYVELYRKYGDSRMILPMQAYLDEIMGNPSTVELQFVYADTYWSTERWSWCDALFMGPTVWTKMAVVTGKKAYLDFMYNEYKATTDYLYSSTDHLFYRDSRFFDQREENGEKVFWGRGNGWVFAGLPIILRELPEDYAKRDFFETLYTDMASAIVSLQDAEGYWHASMLDQQSYPSPEMSATAFFVWGLAWGVRQGYLERDRYLPAVIRGWQAMASAVWPDGKVGWIQPIGESPKSVTREMTEVYGVGAFLMAGSEVYRLFKQISTDD